MADQNNNGYDFNDIYSELEADNTLPTNATSDIDNPDKPAYVKTPSTEVDHPSLVGRVKDKIKKSIQQEFLKNRFDISEETNTQISEVAEKKQAIMKDISSTIAQEKATARIWAPKFKSTLPTTLYSDKPVTTESEVQGTPIQTSSDITPQADLQASRMAEILEAQRKITVDQFIRNKSDDIVRDRLDNLTSKKKITVLSQILELTHRNNMFFETTFKKYLMTNIELKFKHIFISQDILRHTKLLINTMAIKLDSVKHNTALSDVAKLGVLGEIKRNIRMKLVNVTSDSAIAPFQETIDKVVGGLSEGVRDFGTEKLHTAKAFVKEKFPGFSERSSNLYDNVVNRFKPKSEESDESSEPLSASDIVESLSNQLDEQIRVHLPTILAFVKDLNKHLVVVDIESLKRYLRGSTLAQFEQTYLDSLLGALPEPARLRTLEVIETLSASSKSIPTIDTVFEQLSKTTDTVKQRIQELSKQFAESSTKDIPNILPKNVSSVDTIKNKVSDTVSQVTDTLTDKRPEIEDTLRKKKSSITSQYNQVRSRVMDEIDDFGTDISVASKKEALRNAIRPIQVNVELAKETVQDVFKNVNPSLSKPSTDLRQQRGLDTNKDSFILSSMNDTLTGIKTFLSEQFQKFHQANDAKLQVMNQLLVQLSTQASLTSGSVSPEVQQGIHDKLPVWAKAIKLPFTLGSKAVGLAGKGVMAYGQGITAFYRGLFNTTKRLISAAKPDDIGGKSKSLLIGAKDAAIGGTQFISNVLGKILGLELEAAKFVATKTFSITKTLSTGAFKFFNPNARFVDVYRKDEVDGKNPLIKGADVKRGRYHYVDGTVIKDSFSIEEPVYDSRTRQIVISQEDLDHGLVDNQNKSLSRFTLRGKGALSVISGTKAIIGGSKRVASGAYKTTAASLEKVIEVLSDISISLGKRIPYVNEFIKDKKTDTSSFGIPPLGDTSFRQQSDFDYGFGGGSGIVREDIQTLITDHLVKIKELLVPVNKHYAAQDIREGSYADYKRDREHESKGEKRKRARDLIRERESKKVADKKDTSKSGGGSAILAALGGVLGMGGSGGEGGSSLLGTLFDLYVAKKLGGGLLSKAKDIFTKGAGVGGMAKTALGSLGRLGAGQAARTAAVSAGTALAGTVGAPAIAAGLAIAGLGAGAYGVYSWGTGKQRRRTLTGMRNEVYRVPLDKLSTLIDFEDDLADTLDSLNTSLKEEQINKYIKSFGLNPKDKEHIAFFKYWYSSVFFPIFKASYDIFKNQHKVAFDDQVDLPDEILNHYKHALENTSIYNELRHMNLPLSLVGLRQWKSNGGKAESHDDMIKKSNQARDQLLKNTLTPPKPNEKITNFMEEEAKKEEDAYGAYEDPGLSMDAVSHAWGFLKKKTSDVIDKTGEMASSAGASISAGASQMMETAGEYATKAKEVIKEGADKVVTAIAVGEGLGDVVAKYESGKKGVASISTGKGDPGGASYGKYQLASKTGTLQRYLKDSGYDKQFAGLQPGTPGFNAKWTELAQNDKAFATSQHDFIKKTHYDPAIRHAGKLGFNVNDARIQEAVWSGSIQHGGIKKILDQTAQSISNFALASPEDQIKAYYKTRGDYSAYYMRKNGASADTIQNASYGRYSREMKDVLAMSGTPKEPVQAPLDPNAPSPISTGTAPGQAIAQQKADATPEGAPSPVAKTDITQAIAANPELPKTPMSPIEAISSTQPTEQYSGPVQPGVSKPTESTLAQTTPGTPTSSDTIIDTMSKSVTPPQGVPATASVTNTIEKTTPDKTMIASTPTDITVIDPEAKTHTSLLSEQNALLTKIVSLLATPTTGGNVVDAKGTVNANDVFLSKLDGIVAALQTTSSSMMSNSTAPVQQAISSQPTQSVAKTPSKNVGINVGRVS